MKAKLTQSFHIHCPTCDAADSCVDHVLSGETSSFGPWYCDSCGQAYTGKLLDGNIEVEPHANLKVTTYDLLVLPPQDKPVYFVMKGMTFNHKGVPDSYVDIQEHLKFFYESHSCPTNWLRNVEVMMYDNDDDPHGVIEFVRSIPASEAIIDEDSETVRIMEAFPEVAKDE